MVGEIGQETATKAGRARREATMESPVRRDSITVEALAAAVARSPIVVAQPTVRLPVGFDAVDVAILTWIAAEAHRLRRGLALM